MYQTLQYESADGIGIVRFNRPNKLNAISPEMVDDLRQLVTDVRADKGVRVVVFTGNGRAFCAGADIAAMAKVGGPADFMSFIENVQLVLNSIEDLDRPTIAAINGIAYGGGCEISLCCDFRIIAEDASIGVPEIKIGLLPHSRIVRLATAIPSMLPPSTASNARPRQWSKTQLAIVMFLNPPEDSVPHLMRPVGPPPSLVMVL